MIKRKLLHDWLHRPEWVPADCVPSDFNRMQILIKQQSPFAVLITSTANGDHEQSIARTVDVIVEAHEDGWICSPLLLSYRQERGDSLRSDVALVIYKRQQTGAEVSPGTKDRLMDFVVQTLQDLDHKVALMAGPKRAGRLDHIGSFANTFMTDKLTPILLRQYLGLLHGKQYALLEMSTEPSGIWSRVGWEYRGTQPAVLYGGGRQGKPEFQFGYFECT